MTVKTINVKYEKNRTDRLGHLPDIREASNHEEAAFAGRIMCFHTLPQSGVNFHWILLKNRNPRSKLPLNMHELWKDNMKREVWGDAFICSLGEPPIRSGRANYRDAPGIPMEDVEVILRNDAITRGSTIPLDKNNDYLGPSKKDLQDSWEKQYPGEPYPDYTGESSKDAGESSRDAGESSKDAGKSKS